MDGDYENDRLRLYHGSDKEILVPKYMGGNEDNDYGNGFYTTEDKEKAYAWACLNGTSSAVCNEYILDIRELSLLNFSEYGVLTWIAEVVAHRGTKTEETNLIAKRLISKYKINTDSYDV